MSKIIVHVTRQICHVVVGSANGKGENIKKCLNKSGIQQEILRMPCESDYLSKKELEQRVRDAIIKDILGGELEIVIH